MRRTTGGVVDGAQSDGAVGRGRGCGRSRAVTRILWRGVPLSYSGRMSDDDETLGSPTPETTANVNRDPEEWVTGDEPMTSAQRSYLDTLAREAGEELPADLTKAEASEHIDRLQQRSNRLSDDG